MVEMSREYLTLGKIVSQKLKDVESVIEAQRETLPLQAQMITERQCTSGFQPTCFTDCDDCPIMIRLMPNGENYTCCTQKCMCIKSADASNTVV